MIWVSVLTLSMLSSGEPISPAAPFWKTKEKVYQRIQEERAIIVSVKTESRPGGETMVFLGGGQTVTPLEFTFKQAMQPDNLRQAIDEIRRDQVGWRFALCTSQIVWF